MRNKLLATAIVGACAFVVAVPQAAAAYSYGNGYMAAHLHNWGHDRCKVIQFIGGQTAFCPDGDVFHLFDLNRDGKSLGARWTTSNGRAGLCRWDGGVGKAGDCNYDFPESARVTFSTGLCNQTKKVDCKSWGQYTSRSPSTSFGAG